MPGYEILDGKSPEEQERIRDESREVKRRILETTKMIVYGHPILTREQGEFMEKIIKKAVNMTPEEIETHQKRTRDKILGMD